MENIVRTLNSAYLQSCMYLKIQPVIDPITTLNTKLSIQAYTTVSTNDDLAVRYVAIGNKGHSLKLGTDSIPVPAVIPHLPQHNAPYGMIPFVLREPANDLSASERARFRLRRLESHNNTQYVAYYLMVLDLGDTVPTKQLRKVVDNVTYSEVYTPTLSDLNPTQVVVTSTGVTTTSGNYLAASAKVPFTMTESDVTEFLNVANIIYGDEAYGIISELALCSGVDRAVSGDFNGTTMAYTEAIGVQVCTHIPCLYSMPSNNTGLTLDLDVGAVEPLLYSA